MVFLDNASTTKQKFFAKDYTDNVTFLNSNAEYAYRTRKVLQQQRESIKNCLGLKGGEILFTRCATESADLFKYLWLGDWNFSPKEHNSVFPCVQGTGNEVWIQQTVNQITGEIFNLCQISTEHKFIALDMTAGIGKIKTNIPDNCQALWFSGHKFHAPHIGVLWLCDELMKKCGAYHEEKNQFGLLHGTIDVAGIVALEQALNQACNISSLIKKNKKWWHLVNYLIYNLDENAIDYRFIVNQENTHNNAINAIQLNGINADSLQQFLVSKDIYIGIGDSACAEGHDFRVLTKGYGLSQKDAEQVVRISFDEDNTIDDVLAFVDGVKEFKERFLG